MPIYEFDEWENGRVHPDTGEQLFNYWGYSTVGFFAPKSGYAATGKLGMQMDELKALVKELHRKGIEVFLDVVFNHTTEGDEQGPTLCYRGLENKAYYLLEGESGKYANYSGCGNTLNPGNSIVRRMILDSLHYWVNVMHVDGFRFDLASILSRDETGKPQADPRSSGN
jgi:glycogen operon protein